MSKKYCPSCGFGTSSLTDINFCNSCGYNFKLGKSIAQNKGNIGKENEDDEQDDDLEFNTANLKYKVEIFNPPKYDLGKLAEEKKTGDTRERGNILTAAAGFSEFQKRIASKQIENDEG